MSGAANTARTAFLPTVDYAHRGLHGGAPELAENSMPAFAAALDEGFGIECDVRLSSDGAVFVFHDRTLDRMTSATRSVADRTAEELDRIPINGGAGPVPRLSALLALVNSRAPLLIEIKIDKGQEPSALCAAVRNELIRYAGPVAIMSFHPGVSRWFASRAPEVTRGLVMTEEGRRGMWARLKRHLAYRAARPDFLAYDIRDLPSPFAHSHRCGGRPVLTWTVRTEAQWLTARAHTDAAIFERTGGAASHG